MHLYDHQHSAAYKTSTGNTYRGQCYRDKMTRYPLLWFGQWYFNIALHPCQRLITLNGVDTVAFFLRQFHIGKTVFHPPLWHPDRWSICQNHRGMPLCGYLLFVQKLVKYLRSRCASTNQRQNGSRQAVSDFVFIYIYDEDARAYWQDFQS